MTEQQDANRPMAMVFGDTKRHSPGSDAWFWPAITAEDEEDILPFVLQMGVWGKRITVEQVRELCRQRGADFWHQVDRRTCDEETEAIIALCLGQSRPVQPKAQAELDDG